MLDSETKRRIDTARDILVGKVPDPKSQVEQITIALIYKFMDDMDAESEELGGERKFFAGEFAKYGWAKLMRTELGGHKMLELYGDAIARMPENPGIPPLFREIFKNAYLPYRDPETLRSFLKIIDDFSYDHSERLGDAFEYLLSVLGSQGDAGQFRTPRHIIDFMVSIVDPKKDETVLDPACGTAGFLISSYKHILAANQDADGNSTLTPDDRGRLAGNLKGYDISPDMVRLSLANMYLHGFTDPHISEYDTLTSQDRWNDYADVILANPPFMSPKGGIKPHNRFSVQSKRSEVLFVDYMAEHLTPSGRAGIIVPEGVIFQGGTAYRRLRKMLVDEYLVAVVSLPPGVFNPYSGVKTSILILDRALSLKTAEIAFFKVNNDGFGLGAQRRPISKDDLPRVRAEVIDYLGRLTTGEPVESKATRGLTVPKQRIAESGDYNLSGERYRDGEAAACEWPLVPVADLFRRRTDTVLPQTLCPPIVHVGLENITQDTGSLVGDVVVDAPEELRSLKNLFGPGQILYGKLRPNLNKVWRADREGVCSTEIFVLEAVEGAADPSFFAQLFRSPRFNGLVLGQLKGSQLPRVGWEAFGKLRVPRPPLSLQEEVAAKLGEYQKVIDGARVVVESYRPSILISRDWPVKKLGELFRTKPGGTPRRSKAAYFEGATIPWVKTLDLTDGAVTSTDERITRAALVETGLSVLPVGTVLIAMYGGFRQIGRTGVLEIEAAHNQAMTALLPTPDVNPYYLNAVLIASKDHWRAVANSTRKDPNITKGDVLGFPVPVPPLETQEVLVAELMEERTMVAACEDLVACFEAKIAAALESVWLQDGQDDAVATEATKETETGQDVPG